MAVTFALLSSSAGAESRQVRTHVVHMMARLIAYGELCSDWAPDPSAITALFHARGVTLDDPMRNQLAELRERFTADAGRLTPASACKVALRWFGPAGTRARNLLRPHKSPMTPLDFYH
jgi:hypothetical protein